MPKTTKDEPDDDVQAMIDSEEQLVADEGHLAWHQSHDDTKIEKDHVLVYDQRDGVPSKVRKYQGNGSLAHMLQKRDRNTGKRIFRITPPDPETVRQREYHPCWLHPEHPRYKELTEVHGFPTCGKNGQFATAQDVDSHVKAKHTRIYEFVEKMDARSREDQNYEERMKMLDAIKALAEKGND